MDRSYESNALPATVPPIPATVSVGFPTDGDLGTSTPPTTPGARWFYQITEEIRNVIIAGGVTPNGAQVNQLLAALDARYSASGSAPGSTGSRWAYANCAASAATANVFFQTASGSEFGVTYAGGEVTVANPGLYFVTGTMSVFCGPGYGGVLLFSMMKNGVETSYRNRCIDGNNDGGHYVTSVTGLIQLAAGDKVSMLANLGLGATLEPGFGSFTGFRVA